mmetsp:Transcript_42793/g.137553  ORF Transcript_42793/g.137553 Transcript_42793/m.137553 type:complete len:313 (-) Transcript_42793:147-1085(-)
MPLPSRPRPSTRLDSSHCGWRYCLSSRTFGRRRARAGSTRYEQARRSSASATGVSSSKRHSIGPQQTRRGCAASGSRCSARWSRPMPRACPTAPSGWWMGCSSSTARPAATAQRRSRCHRQARRAEAASQRRASARRARKRRPKRVHPTEDRASSRAAAARRTGRASCSICARATSARCGTGGCTTCTAPSAPAARRSTRRSGCRPPTCEAASCCSLARASRLAFRRRSSCCGAARASWRRPASRWMRRRASRRCPTLTAGRPTCRSSGSTCATSRRSSAFATFWTPPRRTCPTSSTTLARQSAGRRSTTAT